MSHILVVTVSGSGHIEPLLGMLGELVDRGHRVSCPVDQEFRGLVTSMGAESVPFEPMVAVMPSRQDGSVDLTTLASEVVLAMAQDMLPRLEILFENDRPDLIVYDTSAFAGYVLALRWHVPAVAASANRVSAADDLRWTDWLPTTAQTQRAQEHRAAFDRWLKSEGVSLSVVDFLRRPPRCLVFVPRLLQPQPDRFDSDVYTFVGPCIDSRPAQKSWPAPDRPLILVSLGTKFTDSLAFFRDCINAFSGQGWRVVLSVGTDHVKPDDLAPFPSGVEVFSWVPQRSVLRHASLFVTHAGAGSSSEAVTYGVPMIAVPQAVDQFDNAAMLAEAGVAVVIDPDEATPEVLRTAAHEILASEAVAAASRAAARTVPANGATSAADVIETMLTKAASS
jgi:MGT family glycosyltransferase